MFCLASDAEYPVRFLTAGNCISDGGFVHMRRTMNVHVFILVREGTLHIQQHGCRFDVHENEMLLLPAHTEHAGACPSTGRLSFDWVHFVLTDPQGGVFRTEQLPQGTERGSRLILPEYGRLAPEKRSMLLFGQLLDIAKREKYQPAWKCHYALNLLLLEAAEECAETRRAQQADGPDRLQDILEWVRCHYDEPVTVHSLAQRFGYHPTYLTALVKKHTGYSVSGYIGFVRMTVAKNLLRGDNRLPLREIAAMCGFSDEKYFMRMFKKAEGVTPGQYRSAFRQKHINTGGQTLA